MTSVIHFPFRHRIRNYLRTSALRDWAVNYRHIGLRDDDVVLASYPKSGTTWMAFMLAQLLWKAGGEQTLVDNRFLPAVGRHGQAERRLPSGGRLVRSHEPFRPQYRKAIYVVRDGRDVAVSMYWQAKRVMGMEADFSDYLELFLAGRLTGAGAWAGHVEGWLDSPPFASGNVLVARYEDMKEQPADVLRRAAAFLGVSPSDEKIAEAVEAGSMESMKDREKKSSGVAHLETGEKIPVVRKGVVGDWSNYFSQEDKRAFWQAAGPAMRRLGYADAAVA
jgi:hypothetical protein